MEIICRGRIWVWYTHHFYDNLNLPKKQKSTFECYQGSRTRHSKFSAINGINQEPVYFFWSVQKNIKSLINSALVIWSNRVKISFVWKLMDIYWLTLVGYIYSICHLEGGVQIYSSKQSIEAIHNQGVINTNNIALFLVFLPLTHIIDYLFLLNCWIAMAIISSWQVCPSLILEKDFWEISFLGKTALKHNQHLLVFINKPQQLHVFDEYNQLLRNICVFENVNRMKLQSTYFACCKA